MTQDSSTEFDRRWRDTTSRSSRTPVVPSRFAVRRVLVATGLLVAVATAGGMISWFVGTPRTHLVSCSVARFSAPAIPSNPAAECDHLAIMSGDHFAHSDVASTPIQSRFLISQQLNALEENGGGNSFVLYVATYAVLDSDGRIVLLTSDYDPGRPESGLPLSDVLRSLEKSSAGHKLLVLDICWPNLLPAISGGVGDVAAALPGQLRAVPDSKRLVLSSCSPGQVALDSETLGRSVFGYYFEQALLGAADRYGDDSSEDGRVTVREAAQFIAAHVDRWAMRNRASRQTPMLFGDGDDFELTACGGKPFRPVVGSIAPTPAPASAKQNSSQEVSAKSGKSVKNGESVNGKSVQNGKSPPDAHPAPSADSGPLKYPEWLLAGWKQRDQWRVDGTSRVAPRLYQQLESRLLRYERQWRFSHQDKSLKISWQKTFADLKRKVSAFNGRATGPSPPSLAALQANRYTPDPAVRVAVSELLNGLNAVGPNAKPADRQAAQQALLAELAKKTKDAPDADLALAVFEEVAQWPDVPPAPLSVLVGVLRKRQLTDRWIETRFLDRLDELASTRSNGDWNPGQTARLLRLVQRSEQVFCRSGAMPWTSQLMKMAAQSRHDAEFCFWYPGYTSSTDVNQALEVAENWIDKAAACQAVFVDAWSTYAQAMESLPRYSEYVDRYPAAIVSWSAAINATVRLAELIEEQANSCQAERTVSDDSLEPIRRATGKVRGAMAAVLAPFTTESVNVLVRRCTMDNVRADVFTETDAVLATPLAAAADRARLWHARATLSLRFNDRVAKLDNEDVVFKRITPALSGYDAVAAMRTESTLAQLRARVSLDLLRLGGMAIDRAQYEGVEKDAGQFTSEQAHGIAALWNTGLRKQLEAAQKVGRQDRLSRVFPPLSPMDILDSGDTNPTLRLVLKQRRELWAWQADRYRYETRDGVDPEFYANLAVQFAPYLAKTAAPSIQIGGPITLDTIVPDGPTTLVTIPWSSCGTSFASAGSATVGRASTLPVPPSEVSPSKQSTEHHQTHLEEVRRSVTVDVLNPAAPWLKIDRRGDSTGGKTPSPLVLEVALAKGMDADAHPPRGFTVRWSSGGRTFYQRINVPALEDQSHLTILLSPDAKHPERNVEAVRLRPGAGPAAYHLFVRNDGRKSVDVLVELSTGDAIAKPLEITAGNIAAVKFPQMPATTTAKQRSNYLCRSGVRQNSDSGNSGEFHYAKHDSNFPLIAKDAKHKGAQALPQLDGPLKVLVRDANTGRELAGAVFPIEIIGPRQFVSVEAVRFTAKDAEHNRLEVKLRQTGSIPGKPCKVQLNLDAAHVPGLINMGDGVFQGTLKADGTPLVLFARNLHLADGVSEQGEFSLTIDGIPRAMVLDTTFLRSGGVTTPVEAIRPVLRLAAPRTGRSGEPFSACIETDYAPATATVEIGLGRKTPSGALELDNRVIRIGGRCHRIGFTAAGNGGTLAFDGVIADWDIPLETAGIVGRRTLRARLLADDGREIAVVQQEVVLGNRPPQGVAFENLPQKVSNREPLRLRASALRSIPEISDVTFFVGGPQNGAIPKDAVSAAGAADGTGRIWSGRIQLKPTVKGKIPISARFTNAAGLSSIVTSTLEVTDSEMNGGKIVGKVVEGSIPQPGIEVVLVDAKGTEKAKATTDAEGAFTFTSLKPGGYTASAAKPTSGRYGAAAVQVKGHTPVEATIELWL